MLATTAPTDRIATLESQVFQLKSEMLQQRMLLQNIETYLRTSRDVDSLLTALEEIRQAGQEVS